MKGSEQPPDLSAVRDISSILVVRLKALGDIALSLPIVRALRRRFPKAHIAYLCWDRYAEVLAGEESIDDVLALREGLWNQLSMIHRLQRSAYDCALDLLGSPRSALITFMSRARMRIGMDVGRHRWCYHYVLPRVIMEGGRRVKCYTMDSNREIIRMLKLDPPVGGAGAGMVKGSPDGEGKRYDIGLRSAESQREWASAFLDGVGVERGRLIGCVAAATYPSKAWPLESYIALLKILEQRLGLVAVLLWGPGEEETAREIARAVPASVLAPSAGIARTAALISELKLIVTPDSGPKHLAVMQGVPTVTLFGPTDPAIWNPPEDKHRALYLGLPCSPCRKRDCTPNICLTGIQPEEVASQIADLLEARRASRVEDSM